MLTLIAALISLQLQAADSEPAKVHASDALFAADHLIQVEITMAPEDWQALRISHRETGEDFAQVAVKPYEYYPANVIIDGYRLQSVGIRKKGFIGSAISTRPSLKLKLDNYVEDQSYSGLEMLTFNNNNQDATKAQTYLVYRFMNEAGARAPRSNFARIIVNGEDLGIYSHVESVRKPMIKRLFGKSKGDLWEGYAGDFTEDDYNRIVHKWGKDDDGETLQELYDLLQSPEPVSLEALEKLLDLDAFITLWAGEVLIGHWDGYAGNRNNYYIYREPKSDLFYFLPWGPDSAFWDPGPFLGSGLPKSFKARGKLCQRLWEVPEARERYRREMQRLLNEVWKEDEMLAELQKVQELTRPFSTVSSAAADKGVASIRQYVEARRQEVQAELDLPAVDWPKSERGADAGPDAVMEISGEFSGLFQATTAAEEQQDSTDLLNRFAKMPVSMLGTGKASVEFTIDGESHKPFTKYGVRATSGDPDFIRVGYPMSELIASSESGHPPMARTSWMSTTSPCGPFSPRASPAWTRSRTRLSASAVRSCSTNFRARRAQRCRDGFS
jgi:spore coat protein CotH